MRSRWFLVATAGACGCACHGSFEDGRGLAEGVAAEKGTLVVEEQAVVAVAARVSTDVAAAAAARGGDGATLYNSEGDSSFAVLWDGLALRLILTRRPKTDRTTTWRVHPAEFDPVVVVVAQGSSMSSGGSGQIDVQPAPKGPAIANLPWTRPGQSEQRCRRRGV